MSTHLIDAAAILPAPVEAEEEFGACANCGSTDLYDVDDCDSSTGYYDCVLMCRTCGGRAD